MPYVNVKITKGGVTVAQKKKLVADITATLVSTLGKKPQHIHIVIDEIDPENWGFAGMLTTEYRATSAGGTDNSGRKHSALGRKKNA